jgi:hypothetical protein
MVQQHICSFAQPQRSVKPSSVNEPLLTANERQYVLTIADDRRS